MRLLQSAGCLTPAASLVYGVVGLLLLGQFGGQVLDYLRTTGWEQVPGTIVSSEVEDAWDTTGDRYAARVMYIYTVDGMTYEGNQVNLGGVSYTGNREDAARILMPYPPGASVMPYIDPDDPSRAVLDRSLSDAVVGIVALGSVLLLLSLVLGVRWVLGARSRSD